MSTGHPDGGVVGVSVQVGADRRPQLAALTSLDLRTPLAPYLSLRALSSYSGLSVRTLRDRLTDPRRPIPHYRLPGKLLVKRDEFDAWMASYRRVGRPEIEPILADDPKRRPTPSQGHEGDSRERAQSRAHRPPITRP